MTSERQRKKKAKNLAAKHAAQENNIVDETPETEGVEDSAPPQDTSKFAKDPLAGVAPEGSDIKEVPLPTAQEKAQAAAAEEPVDPKKKDAPKQEATDPNAETPEQAHARRKKCAQTMSELWEIRQIDPALEEVLEEAKKRTDKRFGEVIDMKLANGNIHYYANFAGQGYEFIGVTGKEKLDPHATIAAAKSKGWDSVKLHGSTESKNEMWLECQRQGIRTSYEPPEGSDVRKTWKKEYDSMVDKTASGVRQEAETPPAPAETKAPAVETTATAPTEKAPAASAPAAETATPAESRFTKQPAKEQEAKAPAVASAEDAAFSQYLQEKSSKSLDRGAFTGLQEIKKLHDSGAVKLGAVQMTIFKERLEGKGGYNAAAKFFEQSSNPAGKSGEGVTLPRAKSSAKAQHAPR